MDCNEFEGLLAEAAEGRLQPGEMERFRAHAAACQLCGPSFADAQAGHDGLAQLEEIEPPANLIHNILAATSGHDESLRKAAQGAAQSWLDRLRAGLRPALAPLMQPRLAGTFAMAFFSVAVLLNIAGVRLGNVRAADLKPSAIRATLTRSFYTGRAQVLRYYDNMRFVYEWEARLRDLRNALPQQTQPAPEEKKDKKQKDDHNISNHPRQQQQQYVQADPGDYQMARLDVVPVPNRAPAAVGHANVSSGAESEPLRNLILTTLAQRAGYRNRRVA